MNETREPAADLMVIHFRPTLDDIATAQDASRHWVTTLALELTQRAQ